MPRGTLFIVSGPSGVGKSTLIESVQPYFPDLRYSISCTTREPRKDEADGEDYYFVSTERFSELVEDGEFLEWKEVHGNCYGTPMGPVKDVLENGGTMILDIDVEGVKEVIESLNGTVTIFVEPPDMTVLGERLRNRGTESEASVALRSSAAVEEMKVKALFDYCMVNDDLDEAVKELVSIIRKESESRP